MADSRLADVAGRGHRRRVASGAGRERMDDGERPAIALLIQTADGEAPVFVDRVLRAEAAGVGFRLRYVEALTVALARRIDRLGNDDHGATRVVLRVSEDRGIAALAP